MYAKALEEVGSIDNPDAVVDALLKMKYQGVVSPVPLVFNPHHQVTFATEVCVVQPSTSDQFIARSSSLLRLLLRVIPGG